MASSKSRKTSLMSDLTENQGATDGKIVYTALDHDVLRDLLPPTKKLTEGRKYITRKTKKRAVYWENFLEYVEKVGDTDTLRAECKFCDKTFAADPNINGSSNIKNHSEKCLSNPANNKDDKDAKKQTELVFPRSGDDDKSKTWILNVNEVREALIRMIIIDELPFRFVEKPGFRHLMNVACPRFHMPSRITIARDCLKFYVNERTKLKEFFSTSCQRISVTTDTWTSIQRINYMCLTGSFIDNDWKLQKRIINFCPISSHKGEDISKAVEACLEFWGLDDKLFTVTVDNASSNDVACIHLRKMVQRSLKGCISDGKFLHLRCIAHILNLIVWDGLNLHVQCIDRIRNAVKHIRNSPARLRRFKEIAEKLKIESKSSLSLDVPTRWNSTYIMLVTAILYRACFSYVNLPNGPELKENEKPPTDDDWNKVEILIVFLKGFYQLTCQISGSLYVTSNKGVFEIASTLALLKKWEKSTNQEFVAMAKVMRDKYNKYWGDVLKTNLLIYMAVVLDPQYKLIGVEVALIDMYGQIEGEKLGWQVKDFAFDLFEEYRLMYAPQNNQGNEGGSAMHVGEEDTSGIDYMRSLQDKVKRLKGSNGGHVRTEFDRYLSEQMGDDEEKDVLTWWKLNELRFPILARMARDILAMPLSTVASESAFSVGIYPDLRDNSDPGTQDLTYIVFEITFGCSVESARCRTKNTSSAVSLPVSTHEDRITPLEY